MIETHMVTLRDKSFDAEVTEREYSEDADDGMPICRTGFVLHIHTHPKKVNFGIPTSVITVATTQEQARAMRDALNRALDRYDRKEQ